MRKTFMIIFSIIFILPAIAFSQDRESEARKMYLEASRAVRNENFQKAERLLKKILDEYLDTGIALKADELLNGITGKLKAAKLPKAPGFYVLLKNGDLVKLEKLVMKKGNYGGKYIQYATFKLEEIMEIYADELDRFYVYNPKAELSQIKWSVLYKEEVAQGAQPTDNWIILDNWSIPTEQGEFSYDDIVFNEVKRGLFEVGFPEDFSPTLSSGAALIDGSPYIGVVAIQPKMVNALYPLTKYWHSSQIYKSQRIVGKALEKHPEKPELHLFSGILSYKLDYKRDRVPEKAKQIAIQGLQVASHSTEVTDEVVRHLKTLLSYCRTDSLFVASRLEKGDSRSSLLAKQKILLNPPPGFKTHTHKWQMALACNYAVLGDFNNALSAADRAIEIFKKSRPHKALNLGFTKIDFKTAATDQREQERWQTRSIDDMLIDYYTDIEYDLVKKFKKDIECQQILAQVKREYIDGGGDPKAGLKLVDKAKKRNKNNILVYKMKAYLLKKLGKQKDAMKALKDIDKAKERIEKKKMKRIQS